MSERNSRLNRILVASAVAMLMLTTGLATTTMASATEIDGDAVVGSGGAGLDLDDIDGGPGWIGGGAAESSAGVSLNSSCVDQVEAIAAKAGVDPSKELDMCKVQMATTVSAPHQLTPAEAAVVAKQEGLTGLDAKNFVVAAAQYPVYVENWRVEAKGKLWSYKEVLKGRTFYDTKKAWVAKHRGYTGSYQCHAAGSYSVVVTISQNSCRKARTKANGVTHAETFDVSVFWKGFPISVTYQIRGTVSRFGSVKGTVK